LNRSLSWAEQRLAVAVAEQEDKALHVLAQLGDVIGDMADELFQTSTTATSPASNGEGPAGRAPQAASRASSVAPGWAAGLVRCLDRGRPAG